MSAQIEPIHDRRVHAAAPRLSWRDCMPRQRKIAVVGKAMDTMLLAPYHDPSWQIWVMNDTPTQEALREKIRWDVCFDVHADDDAQRAEFPLHYEWLRKGGAGKPVFMGRRQAEYPDSIGYPLEEVLAEFPRKYLTNSASIMLAVAILMRPEAIGLWGVNMSQDTEYGTQRPSCEYYIGLAEGRGIPVFVPPGSDLLKSAAVYGIEDNAMLGWWQSKVSSYKKRQANAQEVADRANQEAAFMEGALQAMQSIRQHVESGGAPR